METLVGATVALFAIGTLWFWVLLGVASILLILTVEFEKPGWATMLVLLAFGLLALFGDFNVFAWIADNPAGAAMRFVAYVVTGVAWSFGKWWFFVRKLRRDYEDARENFMRSNHADPTAPMSDGLKRAWLRERKQDNYPPKAREHRSRILMWMTYWPWSALWTLINDPIRRLFRALYEQFQAAFERISQHAFRKYADDFREPPPPPPDQAEGADDESRHRSHEQRWADR